MAPLGGNFINDAEFGDLVATGRDIATSAHVAELDLGAHVLRARLMVQGELGVVPGGSVTLAEACMIHVDDLAPPKWLISEGGVDRTERIYGERKDRWEVRIKITGKIQKWL